MSRLHAEPPSARGRGAADPGGPAGSISLIAFDVDGTLVTHPEELVIWQLLNRRYSGGDALDRSRYLDYTEGRIDYATWVALDVEDWIAAGATREEIRAVVRELQPVEGAVETLHLLRDRGYRLAVISGTLDVVLDEFFPEHPFAQVFTNRLHFDAEGRLSGWEATPYDMEGKARALRHLADLHGLPLGQCAFVGDNANDLEIARVAGFAVAFNPKVEELERVAHRVVRSHSLWPVGELFPGRA